MNAPEQAEPILWVLCPKVQRFRGRLQTRGLWSERPTAEQIEMAEVDGEEYMSLYTAAPAQAQPEPTAVPAAPDLSGLAKDFAEYLYRTASQAPFEHAEWARQRGAALLEHLKGAIDAAMSAHQTGDSNE